MEEQRLRHEQSIKAAAAHSEQIRLAEEEKKQAKAHQQIVENVFENCIFMRSAHLSEPNEELLNDCLQNVPPADREAVSQLVVAEWPERQERRVSLDAQETAADESAKRARTERWSGHAPIWITDKWGRTDFETSRKVEELLYEED